MRFLSSIRWRPMWEDTRSILRRRRMAASDREGSRGAIRKEDETMKTASLVVLALSLASPVMSAEITVLSTGGARAVMTSLVPEYERISGDRITINFATPGQMQDRLVHGEVADVAVG